MILFINTHRISMMLIIKSHQIRMIYFNHRVSSDADELKYLYILENINAFPIIAVSILKSLIFFIIVRFSNGAKTEKKNFIWTGMTMKLDLETLMKNFG